MSKVATIIGSKNGKWSSIEVGTAPTVRTKFKKGKFVGFERVLYLDSSGGLGVALSLSDAVVG